MKADGSYKAPRCRQGALICWSLFALFYSAFFDAHSQDLAPEYFSDSAITPYQYLIQNIDKFATPEYYQRKQALRSFQQRGYAEVLINTLEQDGLSALISYLKMVLQIEYSLNHAPVYYVTKAGELVELPIDYDVPEDPWRKE